MDGISGDLYYRNGEGRIRACDNEWLEANIRRKGRWACITFHVHHEGDTPSYLGLIDNGLNAYRRRMGGWGRYCSVSRTVKRTPSGSGRRRVSAPSDRVLGTTVRTVSDSHIALREAYQTILRAHGLDIKDMRTPITIRNWW